MFCSNCGSQIEEGRKFCSNCGAQVENNGPATQTATQAVEPQVVQEPMYTNQAPVMNQNQAQIAGSTKVLVFGIVSVSLTIVAMILDYYGLFERLFFHSILRYFRNTDYIIITIIGIVTSIAGIVLGAIGLNSSNSILRSRGYLSGKEKTGRHLSRAGLIVHIVLLAVTVTVLIIVIAESESAYSYYYY